MKIIDIRIFLTKKLFFSIVSLKERIHLSCCLCFVLMWRIVSLNILIPLLEYNSYFIKLTQLKFIIQWILLCWQNCISITTLILEYLCQSSKKHSICAYFGNTCTKRNIVSFGSQPSIPPSHWALISQLILSVSIYLPTLNCSYK